MICNVLEYYLKSWCWRERELVLGKNDKKRIRSPNSLVNEFEL